MKVELSPSDKKQLDNALQNNSVRRWLQQKDQLKFEIGDVLLKYHLRTNYETKVQSWIPENINSDNKMAQRYVYVYEDEYGIGFVKKLKVSDGSLGVELHCLTDFDLTDTKFEVDPEYAENVLLDGDFDIKQIHKASLAQRKIVIKMNRKIGVKPKSVKDLNEIFDKLKVGDTFWTTSDYTGRYLNECKISKLQKIKVSDMNKAHDWNWDALCKKNPSAINDTYTYKVTYTGSYNRSDYNVTSFIGYILYPIQHPALEEKKK